MKELRVLEDELMEGQRGSRLAKWIISSKAQRDEVGLADPQTLQILGHVVHLAEK